MVYRLNKVVSISELAKELKMDWQGVDVEIENVSSEKYASLNSLTFSKDLPSTGVSLALISPRGTGQRVLERNGVILSDNPRLDFIRALIFLERNVGFSTWSEPAHVHATAKIGQNVVIEEGCVIGENTVIEHNVVLHAGTRIGKNSRIRSCSSIGSDGFGFERGEGGIPLRFPHLGGVLIGDDVEIGSCTTVARGTLNDTVIEDRVKIDNLVHIAHNCLIKRSAFIIACAEISGGVVVGESAWIAPNSCTYQKISIGERSLVGLGAVVTKDVQAGFVYAGNPAKKIREL